MTGRELLNEDGISVLCKDHPDHEFGGACHWYEVRHKSGGCLMEVKFQHGPIGEVGVNGVQHRHLLAILEDRLRAFQLGAFSSPLNEIALGGVHTATAADQERTARRSLAGVEGFNRPASSVEGAGS